MCKCVWLHAEYAAQYRDALEVDNNCVYGNQAVYFWESEKRIPGVLHLKALARLFECDISDFLQEKEGNRIGPSSSNDLFSLYAKFNKNILSWYQDNEYAQLNEKNVKYFFAALCLILFDLLAQKQNSSPGHIETRRALKEIPLVSEFDAVLARCTLNDEDKAILRMHYVQRKDFRYIGDSLGFSERTIKERHRESLRKISHVL